jgi:hypothetical protein
MRRSRDSHFGVCPALHEPQTDPASTASFSATRSGEALAAIVSFLTWPLQSLPGRVPASCLSGSYVQTRSRHRFTSSVLARLHKQQLRCTCQTIKFTHERARADRILLLVCDSFGVLRDPPGAQRVVPLPGLKNREYIPKNLRHTVETQWVLIALCALLR